MDPGELQGLLARVDLFRSLASAQLRDVAALVAVREIEAGHTVIERLNDSKDVYSVLQGRLVVNVVSPVGREVVFRTLGVGDSFGEIAAIDGGPRSANVTAASETRLAVISQRAFRELIHRHPEVASATMEKLSQLIRRLSDRVYRFSKPGRARIASELVYQVRHHPGALEPVSLNPAPVRSELAALADTNREAVSRTFTELEHAGVIKRQGRTIVVLDYRELCRQAELE